MNTPITDAFAIKFKTLCGEKYWVPVDIAIKLESDYYAARAEMIRWMAIAEGRGRTDDKPDTQAELTMKTPKEKASEDIIDAWLIEGVHPPTHRKLKEQLRQEWPVLAKAIERLVNAEDSPELADAIRQRDEARGQRDRLAEILGDMKTLAEITKERNEARWQRDRLLEEREQWRLSSVCRELVEQRDRLVKVIESASVLIAAKGRHNTMLAYDGLREALQSLTLNEKP